MFRAMMADAEAPESRRTGRSDRAGDRRRRGPRRVTKERLERAALHYLERFASSAENLRRMLMRRVERSARAHGTDRETGAAWVAEIVESSVRSGLVDDRSYAEGRALTLFRRGASSRAIRAQLRAKGVADDDIQAALARLAEEAAEPETAAAAAYARRRRLGPYRAAAERTARREKDLAAMARAGFAYDLARRIIDADDAGALEDELGAG